jgi:hypothetical protein
MIPLSAADLIGRIPDDEGSLHGRLARDIASVSLPVTFLVFDLARGEMGDAVTMPAAYFFMRARHVIALSDEVVSGPDLTIIAHEVGHARLFEEGYPLCAVDVGLTGEKARFYRYLAAILPTALQDPIVNARLAREGFPVEESYVRLLAPDNYHDSRSGDEAFRAVYALSVFTHLQVFAGNAALQGYWNDCISHDAEVAEVVAGLVPPAPSSMTPGAMRASIARFCTRYDHNRCLRPVSLPLSA